MWRENSCCDGSEKGEKERMRDERLVWRALRGEEGDNVAIE